MKYNIYLLLILLTLLLPLVISTNYYPIAIIHGFRQSCSEHELKSLESYLQYKTNRYAKCIETGGDNLDISRSFKDQAKKACEIISKDGNYNGDFAIVSISQGGVLSRYVIEKCQMQGRVKVFVSIGGPLAGTHQLPHCLRGVTCHLLNSFADWFVYKGYVQDTFGPSGYFRVSNHLSNYKKSKSLLLDINNQGKTVDEEAKTRFTSLEKLVLIAFKRDTMITPRESAHFGEYDKDHKVVPMEQTDNYKYDLFGLKTLVNDPNNKVVKIWIDDKHCWYSFADVDLYMLPYLVK